MQKGISRRQKIAVIVTAAADALMLIAAMVLDAVRDGVPSAYVLEADGNITVSHPFDCFGFVAAAALVIVTAMFAAALVNIISSDIKKRGARIAGFSALFAASVAAVMFSYLWVRGAKPINTSVYNCTDSNMQLALLEENYTDDFGTLTVFAVNEQRDELALLAATDIHSRSDSSDDYCIDWIMDGILRITFLDGSSYRAVQIDLLTVLDEEQQQIFLGGGAYSAVIESAVSSDG